MSLDLTILNEHLHLNVSYFNTDVHTTVPLDAFKCFLCRLQNVLYEGTGSSGKQLEYYSSNWNRSFLSNIYSTRTTTAITMSA